MDPVLWQVAPGFGRYLRKSRLQAGLTIEDAAAAVGTSFSNLARLEREERTKPPTQTLLVRLAEAYGLSPSDVAKAAGSQFKRSPEFVADGEVRLAVRFRRLVERFKPFGLDARGMRYYSPRHKEWAIGLAIQVEQRAAAETSPGPLRDELIRRLGVRSSEEIEQLLDEETEFRAWTGDPGFGDRLKGFRIAAGLTLRQAAELYGTSHSRIAQLENRTWKHPPTRDLMVRFARAYGLKGREVMEAAGFRSSIPPDVQLGADPHQLFHLLIVELGLRPDGMQERDHALFSTLQKQQMIDLAEHVDAHARELGVTIDKILAEDSSAPNR